MEGNTLKRKHSWLNENLKQLPLLLIIAGSICVLLFLGYFFIDGFPGSSTPSYFVWNTLLTFINLIIIPLGIINSIFLLKKIVRNKSPWTFMFVKYIALFIGVTISTFLCYAIEGMFENAGLIEDINSTNITIQGHKLDELQATLIFNNIISLLISVPIFIKQSRNQEIALKLKEKELQLSRSERMKTKAQLEVLQSKINPHFLYNALNSIASLAHDDPEKVEKMAISLSRLFRYSINTSSNNFATISEEIDIANTYLEIEKIRFGEKLNYSIKTDVDKNISIPRFLIQPLVENSIKHGTSRITGNGYIEISVTKQEKDIVISVHDNGPDFPNDLIGGYGLQSTQEKLDLLFPGRHELSYVNSPDKKIIIKLKNIFQ